MKVFEAFVVASTVVTAALADLPRMTFCNATNYCEVIAFPADETCNKIPDVVPGVGIKDTYVKVSHACERLAPTWTDNLPA